LSVRFTRIAQDDGDVAGPVYDLDADDNGILELTKVDTVKNIVAGKFDRVVFKNRKGEQFFPRESNF
jgi:hypothetical protein